MLKDTTKGKGTTAPLICAFVFANAKSRFSHDAAQFILQENSKELEKFKYLKMIYAYMYVLHIIFKIKLCIVWQGYSLLFMQEDMSFHFLLFGIFCLAYQYLQHKSEFKSAIRAV